MTSPAIWQEVEFGSYGADLPALGGARRGRGGPVAELGAGAGRVALHLAGHGHEVIAVERDLDLAAELEGLAAARGVSSRWSRLISLPAEIRLPAARRSSSARCT